VTAMPGDSAMALPSTVMAVLLRAMVAGKTRFWFFAMSETEDWGLVLRLVSQGSARRMVSRSAHAAEVEASWFSRRLASFCSSPFEHPIHRRARHLQLFCYGLWAQAGSAKSLHFGDVGHVSDGKVGRRGHQVDQSPAIMRMRKMATIARPMTKNAIVGPSITQSLLGSWGSQIKLEHRAFNRTHSLRH
jgi:hypothetical protein